MSNNLFSPFVTVENFPATQPVSGTVSISGSVNVQEAVASTAVITRVATSTTSVTLLAANANRKSAIFMTETGTTFYIAYAATATTTAYTYLVGPTTALSITGYPGVVSVIMASGNSFIQVTELT